MSSRIKIKEEKGTRIKILREERESRIRIIDEWQEHSIIRNWTVQKGGEER